MLKVSFRVLILYLVISLAIGIGIGYATRSGHVNALNSDIDEQKDQLSSLSASVTDLTQTTIRLTADQQLQKASYDALLTENNSLLQELATLQDSYDTLFELGTIDAPALEIMIKLKDQITSLNAESNRLSSELFQLQIENENLKSSQNVTTELNTSLAQQISQKESQISSLKLRITELNDKLTPSTEHATTLEAIRNSDEFKSTDWLHKDYELQQQAETIGQTYNQTHKYIPGEFDCNDMAIDIWNMLLKQNIKSVIVIGNLERQHETLEQSEHAWLDIFNAAGEVFYMEVTTGEVIYGQLADGSKNPRAAPYREGFIYTQPSDLMTDLKHLW